MASSTAASEKRIIGWIEDMIDEQLPSSTDLIEALKDGIALCKLVNRIRAGSVTYINPQPGVLNHLENISAYLQACWTLGVPTDAIFGTQDLFQRRNIAMIIKNLDTLAAVTVSNDSSEVPTVTRDQNGRNSPSDIIKTDELIAENEELHEENDNLRKRVRKLQALIEDHEATIADKDKEIGELNEKLKKVNAQLQFEQQKAQSTETEKEDDTDHSDEIAQKDLKIALLENELDQRRRAQSDILAKIQHLEENNHKLQQEASSSSLDNDTDSRPGSLNSSARSPRLERADLDRAARRSRYSETSRERARRAEGRDEKASDGIMGQHRSHNLPTPGSSPPTTYLRYSRSEEVDSRRSSVRRSINAEELSRSSEDGPTTPRKRTSTPEPPDSRSSSPKDEKRRSLASRTLRGIKERIGSLGRPSPGKDDRPSSATDLGSLVRNIFSNPSGVTFQDVVKINFKKDTSRRLFSLILDQQMAGFAQKSVELSGHAFDMLLFLVNASLLAMGDETETDTIALQVLMRSAFFFYKKEKGDRQFMQEQVRSYDVWKRFEFWEEYFYSEVAHHAKARKDDRALVNDILSEFVVRMKDFGVGGGLIQKLINDVASKDLLTPDEVVALLRSSNPTPITPAAALATPTTVPITLRHTFNQKSIRKPAFCDFCSEFIWGVSKVVYYCADCKYMIHRKCLDECLPNEACSNKRAFGTPFAVSHNVSVTRTANGGYEGLPKEWQDLLEESGIGKGDVLANPHAVLHILEYHAAVQKRRGPNDRLLPTATHRLRKQTMYPSILPSPSLSPDSSPNFPTPTPSNTPAFPLAPPGSLSSPLPPPPPSLSAPAPPHKPLPPLPLSAPIAPPSPSLESSQEVPPMEENEEDETQQNFKLDDILSSENPNTLYDGITQIGQGANAQVFFGLSTKTGEKTAIKKIRWDPNKSQALINEIQIMKSIKHKNVINCSDCFLLEDELWVTMEYVDFGSLTDILDQHPTGVDFPEADIAFICQQTLRGLDHIHGQGIIHRDVKTDNILLGTDGRILLADFGSAARLTAEHPYRKTVIGSPYWMAPELIRGEEYTQKVDIFSFGCMLRELALGEPPFADLPPLKTLFLLATSEVPPLKNTEGGRVWSPLFLDFANKCVRKDASSRPDVTALLQHPFLGIASTQEDFSKVIAQVIAKRDKAGSMFGL